mmetsp:Transcript_40750/g.107948  ORF Transcript_40750/g.107948 Transcript_40750/m.107948 type:complete len:203 (+) Transcript_40750:1987-2595(+)
MYTYPTVVVRDHFAPRKIAPRFSTLARVNRMATSMNLQAACQLNNRGAAPLTPYFWMARNSPSDKETAKATVNTEAGLATSSRLVPLSFNTFNRVALTAYPRTKDFVCTSPTRGATHSMKENTASSFTTSSASGDLRCKAGWRCESAISAISDTSACVLRLGPNVKSSPTILSRGRSAEDLTLLLRGCSISKGWNEREPDLN